jgi:hypothetical protein
MAHFPGRTSVSAEEQGEEQWFLTLPRAGANIR